MSNQAQSWVIRYSRHKGANLLVLLMIANHTHSDGTGAYPSLTTLAAECRMSERQMRRIVQALETSGELRIGRDQGPNGTNLYSLPLMESQDWLPDKMSARKRLPDKMSSSDAVPDKMSSTLPDIFDPLPDILSPATGHFDTPLPDIAMSPK